MGIITGHLNRKRNETKKQESAEKRKPPLRPMSKIRYFCEDESYCCGDCDKCSSYGRKS